MAIHKRFGMKGLVAVLEWLYIKHYLEIVHKELKWMVIEIIDKRNYKYGRSSILLYLTVQLTYQDIIWLSHIKNEKC